MDEKEAKVFSYCLEWAKNYFKSRDAFMRSIVSIADTKEGMVITFKDKVETIYIIPELEKISDSRIIENLSIITLNNRKNIDILVSKWQVVEKIKNLKFYFINPLSQLDKKWIINPQVHSRICDDSSLKQGLIAMFETVEPLTFEMLISKL